ncbi:tetratricopeptide repeat protein [Nocardioides sp.]|uniref:tetratricopeptide repeat protein n=1 Tax=Nocardioides sp. TaxID=35761 RepID=UPI00261BFDB2|nr:tetratricopeptide repeat protein [Nocardioides sp.]
MSVDRVRHLIELGRWTEALEVARTALASDPGNEELLGYTCLCQCELGALVDASAIADAMVAARPGAEWGHRLRSQILGLRGHPEEALESAREAVLCGPHSWLAQVRYADAEMEVNGPSVEALAAARRAVSLAPNEPDTHFLTGVVLAERNEVAEARASYERALAIDPEHVASINNLTVLRGVYRIVGASRGFASALRINPQIGVARENLDLLVLNFTLLLYLLGAGCLIAAGIVVKVNDGPGVPTYLAAVGVTAALVGYVGLTARGVPRSVRRYAWSVWKETGTAQWNTLLAVAAVVVAYVVCFAEAGPQITPIALRPVLLGLVILGVRWVVLRSRSHR